MKRISYRKLKLKLKAKYFKKPRRLELRGRFFYLYVRSNYFGRLVQKVRSIGISRANLLGAYNGICTNSALLKTCPRRLNYLIFRKLRRIIYSNFLADRLLFRLVKRRIKQKMKSGTVYNIRVLRGLPVHGQRNKTNSRSARSYFKKLKLTTVDTKTV